MEFHPVRRFRFRKGFVSSFFPVFKNPVRFPPEKDISILQAKNGFRYEKPDYSDDIQTTMLKPPTIEKGNTFDVISLLSTNNLNNYLVRNNGDRVEVESCLKGKYILLCCFFVPILRDQPYLDLLFASSELSVRDDFEMVVVVKMRSGWVNDETVFNRFVSGFSCNTLAVPFSDAHLRDYVCLSLNLDSSTPLGLLVDPNQNVVQDDIGFFREVGASAFPFTDERLLFHEKEKWKGQSLESLLCCDFLYKNDGSEKVLISQLNEKLVWLYLCASGCQIPVLDKVYEQCRARGLEFEVVLVYVPFPALWSMEIFEEYVNCELEKHKNISCWILPFSNSVSRRLWRLFGCDLDDRLIIVGPHGKFIDPHGDMLIRRHGINGYPFDTDCLVKPEVERLRQITLESLLVGLGVLGGYVCRGNSDSASRVCVSELQGRNILLYMGKASGPLPYLQLHLSLLEWYNQIKAKDPGFEVVFVSLDNNACVSCMPWFVLPFNPSNVDFLAKTLFARTTPHETLVAYGRDGRIRSLCAQFLLLNGGLDAFPFSDNLHKEVTQNLGNSES